MGIKVVTVPPDAKPGLMERWYTGASWKEIRARAPGTFESSGMNPANPIEALWRIGSENYVIPHWSVAPPEIGRRFAENDLIWSGTVTRGDHVICNRMTYRFRDPARGEIIVFHTDGIPGLPAGQMFVKRLVGLPGERIEIRPPDVFVNGEPVKFPDFFTSMAEKRNGLPGYQQLSFASRSGEFSIAMNRYFVIGDNSPNSSDSRDWGTVPRANIIGCVTRIYWPIARANALK